MNKKIPDTKIEKSLGVVNILPSKAWQQKTRQTLHKFIQSDVTNSEPTRNYSSNRFQLFYLLNYLSMKMNYKVLGATIVGGALIIFTPIAVAAAANPAVPGDALYGVDRAIESIQLSLAPTAKDAANLRLQFAQERLNELQTLQTRGVTDPNLIKQATDDYANETQGALERSNAAQDTETETRTQQQVQSLDDQLQVMSRETENETVRQEIRDMSSSSSSESGETETHGTSSSSEASESKSSSSSAQQTEQNRNGADNGSSNSEGTDN